MMIAGDEIEAGNGAGWRVVCLALSAGALGYALQRRDGLYEPVGFVFLGVSLVFCLLALVPVRVRAGRWLIVGVGGIIAWQFVQMLVVTYPGSQHAPVAGHRYYVLVWVLAGLVMGLVIVCVLGRSELGRWIFFPLCLVVFLVLGWWWIDSVRHPFIDVWEAQRAGLVAFCSGKSPFNAPFPDIYNYPAGYSPGTVVRNGMVELGFPYPPLTLLLDLPGHAGLGDFRYTNLIYVTIGGAAIGYCRRGAMPMLAAILFLTTGRTLFMVELGFTECQVVMLLGLMIFAACRGWRMTAVLLGLLMAGKQYLVIVAPCAVFLIPRPWNWRVVLRWAGIAAAAGLVVSLPIILIDPRGFVRCTIVPIMNAYFRYDALSFLALYAKHTGVTPSASIGFVLSVLALGVVMWRAPRSPAGFAMGSGVVFMLFFAFSKGAFCNYYYLVIALFCAGIAAEDGVRMTGAKKRYDPAEDFVTTSHV
jgi:hypothetical protein